MNHSSLRKIAASTAVICDELGGSVDVFPLMKALYLADREMLIAFARPITGDTYSSMPLGPIVSETYSFIKGESKLTTLQQRWNSAFGKNGNRISPKGNVDTDPLAPVEEKILRESARKVQEHMEKGDLADWMHDTCPEWERVPKGTSKPLPLKRVVQFAMGIGDHAKIEETESNIAFGVRQRARSKLAKKPLLAHA